MKGDPIIFMVRDKNCMVSVAIKDVKQKRIARMSDDYRSEVRCRIMAQLSIMLSSQRMRKRVRR